MPTGFCHNSVTAYPVLRQRIVPAQRSAFRTPDPAPQLSTGGGLRTQLFFGPMKMLARCALPAALAAAMAASPTRAQQNPGLATRPSGFSLDETNAPAEQPIDLTRPNPQTAIDSTSGEELYFDAAMRGKAWAQTALAKIYLQRSEDPEKQRKGMDLLKLAAGQKDSEAAYLLANMTTAGAGVEQSQVAAMENLKKAAEQGNAEAQFNLAAMYGGGRGVARDSAMAEQWARLAAGQGHASAMFVLGEILLESETAEKRQEALTTLEKAASERNAPAAMLLASIYAQGQYGVTVDEMRAEALLKPFVERGDSDCQFALASLYEFGQGFTNRQSEVKELLMKAARSGHAKAREVLLERGSAR